MNTILQKRIKEAAFNESSMYDTTQEKNAAYNTGMKIANFALQNQWVSVEEALPESIVQRVLIVNHHFPFDVYFGRYEHGKWIIEGESDDLWITHWMPILSLEGGEKWQN